MAKWHPKWQCNSFRIDNCNWIIFLTSFRHFRWMENIKWCRISPNAMCFVSKWTSELESSWNRHSRKQQQTVECLLHYSLVLTVEIIAHIRCVCNFIFLYKVKYLSRQLQRQRLRILVIHTHTHTEQFEQQKRIGGGRASVIVTDTLSIRFINDLYCKIHPVAVKRLDT